MDACEIRYKLMDPEENFDSSVIEVLEHLLERIENLEKKVQSR